MPLQVDAGTGPPINSIPPAASGAGVAEAVGSDLHLRLTQLAAVTELVAHIESAGNTKAACQTLVQQLKEFLSAGQVVVGLCGDGRIECKTTAVSDVLSFHPRGELASAAQAVLQESLARGEMVCWPETEPHCSGGLLAHRQYAAAADVAAIVSAPLRDANGQLRGAWMVTGGKDKLHRPQVTGFLQAAATPVGAALHLVTRAQKGMLHRVFHEAWRFFTEKRGQVIGAIVAMLAIVLCVPFPYYPACDCTVEPVTRRFVAAPFSGPLEKSLVKPGDIVEPGQLLAQMNGRQLRMELSGTRADLHRATKEHAGHLATHQPGEAEVARYEVSRLQMRTELLEHREHDVDIISPIAGVVVSGDLEDAEGMPLETGQTLFEIAPLDKMVVEVGIAEDDFAYIRKGMPVTIRLDAYPLRRFKASIARVHPRAELQNDANVFVAEVRLESPGLGLRPGMRGSASVEADRYPLGWNLFRRPITAAIAWLGW